MSFATPGPSRRSGCAYGGRLRSDSTRATRWHVHPTDRANLSSHPAEDPPGPRRVGAQSLQRTNDRPAPVLGPFHTVVDQILADDEHAPPKQRHTAMQVFRRLRDEHGYPGCYGQVQRYLRRNRIRHRETFIPLGHLPGPRLEADFGHIHVDFPDGRRLIPFLVTTWAYSNAPFVM